MNLDYEKVLTRANQLYTEAKIELRKEQLGIGIPEDTAYAIYSDQVKSVLKALIEELNSQKLELNLIPPRNKEKIDTFVEDKQPAGYF